MVEFLARVFVDSSELELHYSKAAKSEHYNAVAKLEWDNSMASITV